MRCVCFFRTPNILYDALAWRKNTHTDCCMFAHTNNYANTYAHTRSCDVRHAIVMCRRLSRCACSPADLNNRANKFVHVWLTKHTCERASSTFPRQSASLLCRIRMRECECVWALCMFVHTCQRCIISRTYSGVSHTHRWIQDMYIMLTRSGRRFVRELALTR